MRSFQSSALKQTVFAFGGVIVLLSVASCSSSMNALVQSAREILPHAASADAVPLDPKFAYLRITRGSHVGFLWRGNTETSPDGPVEVYYSGSGEVLRLQNGRLVGALGLTTEWRRVSLSAPSWTAAAAGNQPVSWVRIRDVMPGYRTGVQDDLQLRVVPPPARSALRGVDPASLTWFEESSRSGSHSVFRGMSSSQALPPARYALDFAGGQETVIYSEQCLAADLCFTWQRWSKAMQQALTASR